MSQQAEIRALYMGRDDFPLPVESLLAMDAASFGAGVADGRFTGGLKALTQG
jgi:hypothetical protein